MIKVVYCFSKRPDLTDQEFFRYWKDVHGPIGRKIPGLRRLIQSHRISDPRITRKQDFDAMAELWFDDLDSLLRARDSSEWARSSLDEKNFIDSTHTAWFISQEHEIA